MHFYVPKTLKEDFDDFLQSDITNQVITTTVFHDWYAVDASEEYRCEWYPDSTKSRYENTDNNINVRFSLDANVHKGDIIQHTNGDLFVLDWEIPPESNNKASRALRCNFIFKVDRWINDIVDPNTGMLVTAGHYETIVPEIPANAYHYNGRPENSVVYGTPGVVPNDLTILTVQYNSKTKLIHIKDTFFWGNDQLEIISISNIGLDLVHPDGKGVLIIQAKKLAGGIDYGT